MEIERQASVLRAMRAWLGLEQGSISIEADLSERTLLDAEKGRSCSDKTWAKLTMYYAAKGLHWREGDEVETSRIVITKG